MKLDNPQFDDLCFIDELSWFKQLYVSNMSLTSKLAGATPDIPPVLYKNSGLEFLNIDDIAKALGITDLQSSILIGLHKQRLNQRSWVIDVLSTITIRPAILIFIFYFIRYFEILISNFLLFIMVNFSLYVFITILGRLIYTLVDKHYAESLSVLTILFALCELNRDNVITHPKRRLSLLKRIDTLARLTRLLGAKTPGGNENTREWSWKHFQNLERYVRENEREIIAPTQDTYANLKEKLLSLFELYLLAHYGDDVWNGRSPDIQQIDENKGNRWGKYFRGVMGLLVPGVLLILISIYPNFVDETVIKSQTLSLIFLSWFILTLDASLGLGIIDKIAKTAKQLRDLK